MIQTSDQANEIYGALAKAQAELENVEKAGLNPAFRAKYAKLGAVIDEVRPKLAKHGITFIQAPTNGENGNIGVVTRLAHSSGQWIESALFVAPTKFDAQGVGSVITYLRRYSLLAMTGVAPDDDDGEAAVGRPEPQRAGMVRAPDARPLAAERAGNGKAATSTAQSPTHFATGDDLTMALQARAEAFRHEMRERFLRCKLPADVDTLIANNSKALTELKKASPEIYAEIMAESTNRKNDLFMSA